MKDIEDRKRKGAEIISNLHADGFTGPDIYSILGNLFAMAIARLSPNEDDLDFAIIGFRDTIYEYIDYKNKDKNGK